MAFYFVIESTEFTPSEVFELNCLNYVQIEIRKIIVVGLKWQNFYTYAIDLYLRHNAIMLKFVPL